MVKVNRNEMKEEEEERNWCKKSFIFFFKEKVNKK